MTEEPGVGRDIATGTQSAGITESSTCRGVLIASGQGFVHQACFGNAASFCRYGKVNTIARSAGKRRSQRHHSSTSSGERSAKLPSGIVDLH